MSTETFKCPNCNAGLVFSPEKGGFSCPYCDASFTEEYLIQLSEQAEKEALEKEPQEAQTPEQSRKSAAQQPETSSFEKAGEKPERKVHSYHCNSCGAEVLTGNTTAATVCYYCGNPVVVASRVTGDAEPDFVIPFSIPKEKAMDSFLNWVRSRRFVPNNFFERSGCTVNGVYYPYWHCDLKLDAHFSGEGITVSTVSTPRDNIITRRHFQVERSGLVTLPNIMRCALTKTDRQLSDGVQPYQLSGKKPFEMGYLSGFSAECRDIPCAEITPEVVTEAIGYSKSLLTAGTHYQELDGNMSATPVEEHYSYSLLPVWVLTYKGKDGTLYHYALNGQTGKACGKLPIDKPRLWGFCAAIGAAVSTLLLLGGWFLW